MAAAAFSVALLQYLFYKNPSKKILQKWKWVLSIFFEFLSNGFLPYSDKWINAEFTIFCHVLHNPYPFPNYLTDHNCYRVSPLFPFQLRCPLANSFSIRSTNYLWTLQYAHRFKESMNIMRRGIIFLKSNKTYRHKIPEIKYSLERFNIRLEAARKIKLKLQ